MTEVLDSGSAPLSQLLPSLYQFLNRPGWRKRRRVDDRALPVRSLIELTHAVLAEQREIVQHLIQVFAGPDLLLFSEIWPPRHNKFILSFSLFIRHTTEKLFNSCASLTRYTDPAIR